MRGNHRGREKTARIYDLRRERREVFTTSKSQGVYATPQIFKTKHITKESQILMSNETELTGVALLMYLMSQFNMTRQEALRNMKQRGHDISKL
jgi:hypothetical protein